MNLESILREVGEYGVKSVRLDSDYLGYVNRATKAIAERHNWTFMYDRRTVTVPSGKTTAPMGPDFKQLGTEESPVSFTYGLYNLPVKVTSRARVEAAGIWPLQNGPFSLPVPGGYMPVQVIFLERNGPGGQWMLSVPPQYSVTTDAVFNVSGYWYPAELVKGEDTNAMTEHGELCRAVVNLAKTYAYQAEETDNPKAGAAEATAEAAITRALYTDIAQSYNGRTLRL